MELSVQVPTLPGTSFKLPPKLEGLKRLSFNMWWSWNPQARALFSRIDGLSWSRYRNPVEVLLQPIAWVELLDDPDFMAAYTGVLSEFDRYMAGGREHWFNREYGPSLSGPIAYFCCEYGFHESLGIYSGGLGVLAGDHIKSASDMAMRLVGVGLLYKHGFFRQTIDAEGRQEHAYPDYDLAKLPILRVLGSDGEPLTVSVELPGRDLYAAVWLVQVGRVPVLLLDTDIPDNAESDRPVTHSLYVRGREMRLHQELVLGAGGVRALKALGITPAIWHLNEGHSAFLLIERARALVHEGVALDEALAQVRSNSVLTIHTPVAAGNERFDSELARRVAGPLYDGDGREGTGGVPMDRVLELARGVDGDTSCLDMTAMSLRLSNAANAVSQLHGVTANNTWQGLGDKHIIAVTNGVHLPTWVGQPMRELFRRYLGAELDNVDAGKRSDRFWERADRIPDTDLWEAHQRQKLELMIFARNRLRHEYARHGDAPSVLEELEGVLDPGTLTIGFGRRFATYKRAGLIFSDMNRISRLLWDADRPVQILFAGKAHPADRPGQKVIEEIFAHTESSQLRGRVFLLEDYDIRVARFMVQGVDVWLNNPLRLQEASGTSGMKASCNGVVNLSVLDGWWDEGFLGNNGWAIGGRETNPDERAQDEADAESLYQILESEVVPLYYRRNANDIPEGWTAQMRRSIASTIWQFSTIRMLHEYVEQMYLPAAGIDPGPPPGPPSRRPPGRRPPAEAG
ncbi:MAG: alpha-glucan family phosphorylase [Candidatus Limnocylindrales bacterium]